MDLTEPADDVFVPITRASTTLVIPPLAEVEPAPLEVAQVEGCWVSDDGLANLTIGPEGETELKIRSGREFTCTGVVSHSAVVHRYEATVSAPVACTPSSSADPVTTCGDVSNSGMIVKGAFYSASCVLQRG